MGVSHKVIFLFHFLFIDRLVYYVETSGGLVLRPLTCGSEVLI